MVHGRANEARFHVRGFSDRGTTTTPFDMVVLNRMSRYQLAIDALEHIPHLRQQALEAISYFESQLRRHDAYIREHFQDMPEIRNWHWTDDFSQPDSPPPLARGQSRGQLFTDA
jgi:xylulose-5-phosphate/fructose-6-phosphate phosphoketolase